MACPAPVVTAVRNRGRPVGGLPGCVGSPRATAMGHKPRAPHANESHEARDVIRLNLSADQDLIDGAPLMRFVDRFKNGLLKEALLTSIASATGAVTA
jgi:hypothetical protein